MYAGPSSGSGGTAGDPTVAGFAQQQQQQQHNMQQSQLQQQQQQQSQHQQQLQAMLNGHTLSAPMFQPSSTISSATASASMATASGTSTAPPTTTTKSGVAPVTREEELKIFALVQEALRPETREPVLLELSKRRESYEDLAPVLWHSYGVMAALLQEIVGIYAYLSPPTLTTPQSNRVCNALALLQCIASHQETRGPFLAAHIPLFLYPFLNTVSKTRPFEYLRLTSLGVIGALVKNDNTEVISFLLQTEIIPLCLRIMESGTEISKTVAIFIVQKILLDDLGLIYICQTYERFYAVGTVLNNMVLQLAEAQSIRILKHVIRCYLRLSDNPRAREALRQCLPEPLRDSTFAVLLKDDTVTKRCLAQLLLNLSDAGMPPSQSVM